MAKLGIFRRNARKKRLTEYPDQTQCRRMFLRNIARRVCSFVVFLHLAAAAAWIFLMPGGFPLNHPRFLANRVIPAVVIGVVLVAIHARKARKESLLDGILLATALGWLSAAVTGLVLFPISGRLVFGVAIVVAFFLALPEMLAEVHTHLRSRQTVFLTLLGLVVGGIAPWTQRAEEATTYPLNPVAEAANLEPALTVPSVISMNGAVHFLPRDGTVNLTQGKYVTTIQPLLTFISRSPDRCWTLLAPRRIRDASARHLTHWSEEPGEVRARYADLGASDLKVNTFGLDRLELDATSDLAEPIYSHLNTFSEVSLSGYKKLSLVFSPCNQTPVEVMPMDYPTGRPARFAYMDHGGKFHVVEASSGEKGPFHELAEGRLGRGDPLEIKLLDSNVPIATIVLEDWSAQASTELSPAAGWGVPQNAIEFALDPDGSGGARIFVSLASTSVGREYDSVGHVAGTYRNRMKVRLLVP